MLDINVAILVIAVIILSTRTKLLKHNLTSLVFLFFLIIMLTSMRLRFNSLANPILLNNDYTLYKQRAVESEQIEHKKIAQICHKILIV